MKIIMVINFREMDRKTVVRRHARNENGTMGLIFPTRRHRQYSRLRHFLVYLHGLLVNTFTLRELMINRLISNRQQPSKEGLHFNREGLIVANGTIHEELTTFIGTIVRVVARRYALIVTTCNHGVQVLYDMMYYVGNEGHDDKGANLYNRRRANYRHHGSGVPFFRSGGLLGGRRGTS